MLRGRVLDPEARPLVGVEVGYRSGSARDGEIPVAHSGANGFFELQVPPGRGDLDATDPKYVTVMRGRVDERTEVEPLVVVAPRIELAGVVQDERGAPLGEVRVSFRVRWPDGRETLISPTGGTARFVRTARRS